MAKTTREEEVQVRAIAEFTDRIDPQKAFWNNFDYILQHQDEFKVLYYYGFGGIGKTALCKELGRQLDEKSLVVNSETVKSKHIKFSFENSQDHMSVLKLLAGELHRKYIFEFPLFYYALYIYDLKTGGDAQKPEVKTLLNSCSYLENALDFAGFIPVIGSIGVAIIKLADKVQANVRDNMERDRNDILYMESLDADDIKEKLPVYFAKDLKQNLLDEKVPMVVFLDTYEKLTNAIRKAESVAVNEEWLWHEHKGVLRKVPNILWVIAGQNELQSRWTGFDKFWDDEIALEEHWIDRLDEKDTTKFLQSVRIFDDRIIRIISERAKGVPITLDLCVDIYYQKISMGRQPSEEDFEGGNEELAKRFVGNLKDIDKDMISLLSCFESWTDEELSSPILGVVDDAYKRVKSLAFIIEENKTYYIHNSVIDVLYEDCGQIVKNRYHAYVEERLRTGDCTQERKKHFMLHKVKYDMEKMAGMDQEERNQYIAACYEELSEVMNDYLNAMEYVAFERIYSVVAGAICEYDVPMEYSCGFELFHIIYLTKLGKVADAEAASQKVGRILDARTPTKYYRSYLKCLVELYNEIGDYEVALAVSRKYYHACENVDTEDIISLNNLADAYYHVYDYERAEEAYAKVISQVAEKHAGNANMQKGILDAYNGLGKVYYATNSDSKALEYINKAIALIEKLQRDNSSDDLQHKLAVSYNKLGDIYYNFGNNELALKYYLEIDRIADKLMEHQNTERSRRDKVITSARIGDFFKTIRQYGDAKNYYDKMLDISNELFEKHQSIKNAEVYIWSHEKIAELFLSQYKYREALQEYFLCLDEYKRKYQDKKEQRVLKKYRFILGQIAFAYMELREYDKALEYCMQELEYTQKIVGMNSGDSNQRLLSKAYYRLGKCYKLKKQYKESLKYYKRCWDIDKGILDKVKSISNLDEFRSSCSALGNLYQEMDNGQQAKAYFKMEYDACEELYKTMPTEKMAGLLSGSASELGDFYALTKKYEKAVYHVEIELDMAKKRLGLLENSMNYKRLIFSFEHLASICIRAGELNRAGMVFEDGMKLIGELQAENAKMLEYSEKALATLLLSYIVYLILYKKDFELAEKYIFDARKYGYFSKELDYYYGKALAYQNYHIDTDSYMLIRK